MRYLLSLLFLTTLPHSSIGQQPQLKKVNGHLQMVVEGKPFLILGGELHNSTASDTIALKEAMQTFKELNYNTILTYAYWEMIEPKEGDFDFQLIDMAVAYAAEQELKLVMVWFGSWKSTASTYVPTWVKTNPQRFKRYALEDGTELEILSPFCEANWQADAAAYKTLMRHIKKIDIEHTVILMQVENEPGCFDNYRDYSVEALKKWQEPVPAELTAYLEKNKENLYPELKRVWAANGYKTKGSWPEVFGVGSQKGAYQQYTEELFMSFHYGKFLNKVAAAGRKEYDLPTFCNGWLYNDRGFYPHATVNPHVLDAYRAAGSALDFYSPNVYTIEYDQLFSEYTLGGNTLFVPESMYSPSGVLHAIGRYNSLGFAPFGVDDARTFSEQNITNLTLMKSIYGVLPEMAGHITGHYGSGKMNSVYLKPGKKTDSIALGDYMIKATASAAAGFSLDFGKSLEQRGKRRLGPPPAETNEEAKPMPFGALPEGLASAMLIQNDENEFYIIGYGVKLDFALKPSVSFSHLNYLSIDEGTFINEQFVPQKRWNGDEQKLVLPENKLSVLRLRLYHY